MRAALVMLIAACHTSGTATGSGKSTPADAEANQPTENPIEKPAEKKDMAAVEELIRNELADDMEAKPSELQVRVMADADVPGVTVFNVRVPPPERGEPSHYAYGVVVDGRVVVGGSDAMAVVARAWGYGKKRTVPPEQVAKVFGMLEGASDEPSSAIIEQSAIDDMAPKWRKIVAVPKETTVNGLPAVEYYVESGNPPLWRTTAVFHPDGKVELKVKRP